MRIEVLTTPLARLDRQENDALMVVCGSDKELQMFTKPATTMTFDGKTYSFKNHQSFGNKNGEDRVVYLYAD